MRILGLLQRERREMSEQLWRTVQLSIVMVFVVVFLMFALVTPLPRPQPYVELPMSKTLAKQAETECDAVVSVTRDGTLFYRALWLKPAQLTERLRAHRPYPRCSEAPLILRVDHGAPFHAVRAALTAAGEAGWKRALIVAQPADATR